MQKSKTQIKNILREKGFKLTPQRIEIINILMSGEDHPSAQDILNRARKKTPKVSISTVYYTLNILKKEGLIREIEFYNKANRYDVNISNHLNLICLECGKIEDFKGALPVSFDKIENKTGFKANEMRFEYYGYCKDCKQKKS